MRIEDTDAERSTEESIQGILDGLQWLGVTWDEGPYFQSQFSEDHQKAAGLPYTIRLKVPEGDGAVIFEDLVYGRIEKKYADIEDFVVCRSNGQPLYLLSNAVDDARDRISHVLRGQDGLANTPKQILIYQALGLPVPQFAHMSLTLDPQRAKISKRSHGELVAVHFYREAGKNFQAQPRGTGGGSFLSGTWLFALGAGEFPGAVGLVES